MRRLRAVVCGTTFGQSYLAALAALPAEFELAGVLARGSDRSAATAERAGVPLFTDPAQLPGDVDVACVVVRSASMGGPGSELARELLARGVHVLQEQPIHHDDLVESLRVARRHGVVFRLGDLYAQLPAARAFTAAAARLRDQQRPVYVDAAAAVQVSFPLVHLLGDALGGLRPWKFEAVASGGPFAVVTGEIAGVPVLLRVQNELDPDDPDNHMHLLARITLGVDGGGLDLRDVHGPVTWTPRLHIPPGVRTAFAFTGPDAEHLRAPAAVSWSPPVPDQHRFLAEVLPGAIGRDLLALRATVLGTDPARPEQYHLGLCRLWQDLTAALGYAAVRPGQVHRPVPVPVDV